MINVSNELNLIFSLLNGFTNIQYKYIVRCKNSFFLQNSVQHDYIDFFVHAVICFSIFFVYPQLNEKSPVIFLIIQFRVGALIFSIWPIDRILSDATPPGQIGPRSNGNEGVLHIPQCSSITEISTSNCLISCPVHSLRKY